MKIHYSTKLSGEDNFVSLNVEAPDGIADPATLALVHQLLQKFMAYDQERAAKDAAPSGVAGGALLSDHYCNDCGLRHDPNDKAACIEGHGDDPAREASDGND